MSETMSRDAALTLIRRIDGGHVDPSRLPKMVWQLAEAAAVLAEWIEELTEESK